jgi:hypothetical protein
MASKPGFHHCPGISLADTYLLAMRCPVYRRRDFHLGFRTELETPVGDVKGTDVGSESTGDRRNSVSRRKAAAFNRWHEPDDARVPRPDLWAAGGEIPPADPAALRKRSDKIRSGEAQGDERKRTADDVSESAEVSSKPSGFR